MRETNRGGITASRRIRSLALLTVTALVASGCSDEERAPSPRADTTVAESIATETAAEDDAAQEGRDAWVKPDEMGAIYAANCAVCHGQALEGGALGPSLLLDDYLHGDSVEAITRSIWDGVPEKNMPAWRESLPRSEARGLAIYILEQRAGGDVSAEGQGLGALPEVPETIATDHHRLALEVVAEGFGETYGLAPLPDGRLLVTEKMRGLSLVSADGSRVERITGTPPVFDDAVKRGPQSAGMGWLHDVELHPDYVDNGWIYLVVGDRCSDCNAISRDTAQPVTMAKLVRGRLDGTRWVDSETVWQAPKETYRTGVENGLSARLAFDAERRVYLTIGTVGDYSEIQALGSPFGKIIRVNDDGSIPPDNPFVDTPGALPGIYTLGHRNAQGIAFQHATGLMWSAEHGPRGGDETNLIRAGLNYGWPLVSLGVDYDGRPIHYAEEFGIEFDPDTLEPPVIDWTPSPGLSSMVFYRASAFPRWAGDLLQASLAGRDLFRMRLDERGEIERELLIEDLGRMRDIEVDFEGRVVFLLEHSQGTRVVRASPAEDPALARARGTAG